MDNTSDFYKILRVNKTATSEEIRKSYKKLILHYHPDKNKNSNSTEMFQKIQIAYETLSNDSKRAKYDTFDSMENSIGIKNLFMYYQELIIEICEKYELSEKQKVEILSLFDPKDYKDELRNNNIITANRKIANKLTEYGSKIFWDKLSDHHLWAGFFEFVISWIKNG